MAVAFERGNDPTLTGVSLYTTPTQTWSTRDAGPPLVGRTFLCFMLSQARLTKGSKNKDATRRVATLGGRARINIPAHQVSSDQRSYVAGVLGRGGPAGSFP